jgi:hypothetical protein
MVPTKLICKYPYCNTWTSVSWTRVPWANLKTGILRYYVANAQSMSKPYFVNTKRAEYPPPFLVL